MSQLALHWSAPDRDRIVHAETLELWREVVARESLKETSFRLNVAPSLLANALAERDRHHPALEWQPAIMELAAKHGLAERVGGVIVEPAGLTVSEAQPLTPEQELARLRATLADCGELGAAVLKKAGLR